MKIRLEVQDVASGGSGGRRWTRVKGYDANGRWASCVAFGPQAGKLDAAVSSVLRPGESPKEHGLVVDAEGEWKTGKSREGNDRPNRYFTVSGFEIPTGPALELHRMRRRMASTLESATAMRASGDVDGAYAALEELVARSAGVPVPSRDAEAFDAERDEVARTVEAKDEPDDVPDTPTADEERPSATETVEPSDAPVGTAPDADVAAEGPADGIGVHDGPSPREPRFATQDELEHGPFGTIFAHLARQGPAIDHEPDVPMDEPASDTAPEASSTVPTGSDAPVDGAPVRTDGAADATSAPDTVEAPDDAPAEAVSTPASERTEPVADTATTGDTATTAGTDAGPPEEAAVARMAARSPRRPPRPARPIPARRSVPPPPSAAPPPAVDPEDRVFGNESPTGDRPVEVAPTPETPPTDGAPVRRAPPQRRPPPRRPQPMRM